MSSSLRLGKGEVQKLNEKKLILLVDDNEFYHIAVKAILNDKYEVLAFKSGQEAVEYTLQATAPEALPPGSGRAGRRIPDLILLDIVMPEMDGWVTYNRLKGMSEMQDVPIAFVTSVDGSSELDHARDVGVADFITKPYDKDDLLDRIEKIINRNEKKQGPGGEPGFTASGKH